MKGTINMDVFTMALKNLNNNVKYEQSEIKMVPFNVCMNRTDHFNEPDLL